MPRRRPSPTPVDPPPSLPDLAADGTLLFLHDVAARLGGISEKTVRRMLDRGELRAVQFRGRLAVPLAELRRYLRGLLEQQGV